jgi:hypothetical protein
LVIRVVPVELFSCKPSLGTFEFDPGIRLWRMWGFLASHAKIGKRHVAISVAIKKRLIFGLSLHLMVPKTSITGYPDNKGNSF